MIAAARDHQDQGEGGESETDGHGQHSTGKDGHRFASLPEMSRHDKPVSRDPEAKRREPRFFRHKL